MPTLELHGDDDDRMRTLAVMLFPSDEENRQLAFARQKVAAAVHEVKDDKELSLNARTVRLLLYGPSSAEFGRTKEGATRAGLIAGDILAMVYLMDKIAKTPKPSINKAVHAYLQWAKTGATFGDGKPVPKSESTVREALQSHRTVCHLWAAVRLADTFPFAERDEILWAGWDTFLGVAAGLFKFGCEFEPSHMKHPSHILDAASCWRMPNSIVPRRLVTDQIPVRLLSFLKGYKAPQPMV